VSAVKVPQVVLVCDGCGKRLNDGELFASPQEARAAGYGHGWRFPPLVRATGEPSSNSSDACPACLPDWKPQARGRRAGYLRNDGTVSS
jgi:hypothetical protein